MKLPFGRCVCRPPWIWKAARSCSAATQDPRTASRDVGDGQHDLVERVDLDVAALQPNVVRAHVLSVAGRGRFVDATRSGPEVRRLAA